MLLTDVTLSRPSATQRIISKNPSQAFQDQMGSCRSQDKCSQSCYVQPDVEACQCSNLTISGVPECVCGVTTPRRVLCPDMTCQTISCGVGYEYLKNGSCGDVDECSNDLYNHCDLNKETGNSACMSIE